HSRPVEHPRENVPAKRVDSEDVVAAWAGGRAERVERVRVLDVGAGGADELDQQRREDRAEHKEEDERGRRERDPVVLQPAPEELERRPCCDFRCALIRDRLEGITRFLPGGIERGGQARLLVSLFKIPPGGGISP